MPDIAFKEGKLNKIGLLGMGHQLQAFLDEANDLNARLDKFNKSPQNLFDDYEIEVRTRNLTEAIENIQMKIGELEMKEAKKK